MPNNNSLWLTLTMLIIGVVIGFGMIYTWTKRLSGNNLITQTKEVRINQAMLVSSIPANWNLVQNGENDCDDPSEIRNIPPTNIYRVISFSPDRITYSDMNWTQTNICVSPKTPTEIATIMQSQITGGDWKKEWLSGLKQNTTVYQSPSDEKGEVSKAGTKGKIYLIPCGPSIKYPCTTIISKSAESDKIEAEEGFQNFINNLHTFDFGQ